MRVPESWLFQRRIWLNEWLCGADEYCAFTSSAADALGIAQGADIDITACIVGGRPITVTIAGGAASANNDHI